MNRNGDDQRRYEVLAEAGLLDERSLVLKREDAFAVFDRFGDIRPYRVARQGLFRDGTRFLSRLTLAVNDHRPLLLGASARDDGASLVVDLTNPDWKHEGSLLLAHGQVHVLRVVTIEPDALVTTIRLRSYSEEPVPLRVEIAFESDFADIFELRGADRRRRGASHATVVAADGVELGYRGLDGVLRRTQLCFEPAPSSLERALAGYTFRLEPGEEQTLRLSAEIEIEPRSFLSSPHRAPPPETRIGRFVSSSSELVAWLTRSEADIDMMSTSTRAGRLPYAGVPWFSTPFGRDALLTSLSMLWCRPDVAVGTLRFLAAHQATDDDPETDAEPGKILHELRGGEMAATREVPFARYYGSVDATPLFVVLAGEYHRRTGDRELVDELWPSLLRAVHWMERLGDLDGDGFVEYRQRSQRGLSNQGWKDSHDAVFHANGALADGPIALCEVQAYVYGALRAMECLCRARGQTQEAVGFGARAASLQQRFRDAFWCEDLGTYALALDGDKKPCRVRTSNAGHALAMGIAEPEHARRLAATLLGPEHYCGWGIRTVAQGERRYNPMAYHNGSVWPHDNALIARGLSLYGESGAATRLLSDLFAASSQLERGRLPELFCGFARRESAAPIAYPLACSPQSWSSAAAFLLLESALGVRIDALREEVMLLGPRLPESCNDLVLSRLCIGEVEVDLRFERRGAATAVSIVRQTGDVRVVIEADRP